MSVRFRSGPLSVSSRGRVGVSAGPVSWSGGGRRRRNTSGGGGCIGLVLFAGLVVIAVEWLVEHWYVSVPAFFAIVFASVKCAEYFAEKRQVERAAWLAAPGPPLVVPIRFSESWFAENVPSLHPDQVPALYEALANRGWSAGKIESRLRPYLDANPFLT